MAEHKHDIVMTKDAQGYKSGTKLSVGELRCIRWCDIKNIAQRVGKSAAQDAPVDTGKTKTGDAKKKD